MQSKSRIPNYSQLKKKLPSVKKPPSINSESINKNTNQSMHVGEKQTSTQYNHTNQISNFTNKTNSINIHKKEKQTLKENKQIIEFIKSNTLTELRMQLAKVNLPFKQHATTMVFSDGDSESPLMFIGEAPGQEEDKQGKPFVGESGKLLETMLNAAGIYRKNYYITNIVPWRPPSNRTPTLEEINIMRPYIMNHIDIIKPKIVVLIGSTSHRAVMNQIKAITTIRGQFTEKDNMLFMPVFHPSYLLRSPSKKKEMWHDILTLKHKLLEMNLNIIDS
ncbi:uracil-DNA glycosylase [Candidatus Cytomitobacter primus]|uniref:Type-4 uracil-DNA glycosylase n=1 Tax=Candidatus Cytomitobacter primus TaxID=2066024 RepID=A0A5C0UFB9_9PROT|nr:uracil-DNA glycosylase [Candidatus Cytomitobacter primus]QEK38417.1 uracil-DNA glycosylase [Candidatus Cytomitobacter primus]